MATVVLKGLRKSFGAIEIIKGIDLTVEDREFVVFVGPSGCGKSTLLRMIAGLEKISAGELLIDGRRSNHIPPAQRGLAMVFQSYALYPHMTIAENMGFALRIAGASRAERASKVQAAAEVLQLNHLLHRRPKELSGGQRQRVAIGRAIVRNPKVFLFDEPLSNLDAALRVQMRIELMRLHEQLAATMVYVTHDQVEAMTMADKIVVMNAGRIEQIGAPLELYNQPRNLFVAGFIGSPRMNMIPARVTGVDATGLALSLPGNVAIHMPVQAGGLTLGATVTLGVRPEHIAIAPGGEVSGETIIVEHLGGLTVLHVAVAEGQTIVVQTDGKSPARSHAPIRLRLDPATSHVFGPDGMALAAR